MEAAPKNFRKFKFLKDIKDAVIELGDDANEGDTYLCSIPVDKEYQIEQKMAFIESNIVKSTPMGNSSGKILKTIVTKDLRTIQKNNFYDKPEIVPHEIVPLQHENFQTIEIKFISITGEELLCRDPNDTITHCHLLIRRFKKPKYCQSLISS